MDSDVKDYFVEVSGKNIHVSIGNNQSNEPKALIVYVFGIPRGGENDKSYKSFKGVPVYLKENYVCATFTPAGIGESTGDTRSLSLHARVEEFLAVINFCQAKYPNLPLFLYGLSMGGHLALSAVGQLNTSGLILTSPALYPDRAEFSLFNGVDFAKTARLTNEDEPVSFSVFRTLIDYPKPVMVIWLEKDQLSKGGPIWDVIYDSVNKVMNNRRNAKDRSLAINGLEHGFKLNGVYPGPGNLKGIDALKMVASEVDQYITEVME